MLNDLTSTARDEKIDDENVKTLGGVEKTKYERIDKSNVDPGTRARYGY